MTTDAVLSSNYIRRLITSGAIKFHQPLVSYLKQTIDETQIQPASLDLSLYTMVHEVIGGFFPTPTTTIEKFLDDYTINKQDLSSGLQAVLKKGHTYIAKCREWLDFRDRDLVVIGNPKSTTGRLGISTRMLTSTNNHSINSCDMILDHYCGDLYLMITPRTFNITITYGEKLHQIRFIKKGNNQSRNIASHDTKVDLHGEKLSDIIGYESIETDDHIMLSARNAYDPNSFWRPIYFSDKILMVPGKLYLLASKPNIAMMPEWCAELSPIDTLNSEFTILHKGFFDPGYGYGEIQGARALFEIVPQIPIVIEHNQKVACLRYESMLETPKEIYGTSIGSNYQSNVVSLAKQFKKEG